jgi:molybdate transport system permease protein
MSDSIAGGDWSLIPLWLSLKVTVASTLLTLPVGILAAWWLAHGRRFRGKVLIETLLTLPLVLPPTVVGYGLLMALGRGTGFGRWLNDGAHIQLLFTWQGAAVAACVMSLPLFIKTASAAFAGVEWDLVEAGRTLGAGEGALLRHVIAPLSYRGVLAALALAFARGLGEFGATLMVAGSIPGQTQTLPLALYDAVQAGEDRQALFMTLLLASTAFVILGGVSAYQSGVARARGER